MGVVRCGVHKVKCCWRCDRCPKCEPETGRLRRGDYCADCTAKNKTEGLVWSDYYMNWVTKEQKALADELREVTPKERQGALEWQQVATLVQEKADGEGWSGPANPKFTAMEWMRQLDFTMECRDCGESPCVCGDIFQDRGDHPLI